jgi:hypothetical protein
METVWGFRPELSQPVGMTLEREGCCSKCLGCFVCFACCQNNMFMHYGEKNIKAGVSQPGVGDYFASSIQPIGGGGLHPRLDLFVRHEGEETPAAVVEGPMCFAGWLG